LIRSDIERLAAHIIFEHCVRLSAPLEGYFSKEEMLEFFRITAAAR